MIGSLTILGCNSALPTLERNATCQFLQIANQHILIDAGECSIKQAMKYKVKLNRSEVICISHLHGDHYFGLFGLLTTWNLNGRTEPLTIICPKALPNIISAILAGGNTQLTYPIQYISLDDTSNGEVYSNDELSIQVHLVDHRVDCFAFRFDWKSKKMGFDKQKSIEEGVEIPVDYIQRIVNGEQFSFFINDTLYESSDFQTGQKSFSYTYITDTAYLPHIHQFAKNSELLYHEATYPKGYEEHAASRKHSTSYEAYLVAKAANVQALILGHYSAKYGNDNLEAFTENIDEDINVILGIDGLEIEF